MEHSSLGCVRELQRGQHACLLYDEHEDPLALVAPYASLAFAAGERCVYVVGEQDPVRIERSLEAAGVDVARQRERGALVLVSRWEVSFPGGEFDPTAMIAYVRQTIAQTLAEGFTGLRLVAEMTWALQMGVGANKLIHYEALGNHLYPDEPLVAICMYNRSRFPAAVCHDAMRVHPWVAVGEVAYDNLYYEPPAAVIDGAAADMRMKWMLGQLERVRAAEVQRHQLVSARAAQAEAAAAAQAKDALLSMLAHELRTPLTSMLAYTQAALRKLHKEQEVDPDWLRRSLEIVARQATRQAKLIDQVLDTARLDSGQVPLALVSSDLSALVRNVAEQMQALAPEHTVRVRAPEPVEAVIDPLRMEQVLINLLDNARKYSPPGTLIEVELAREPDAITLAVRDHGHGIPAREHERIFERFHRLRSDQSGVGLGLHISREIVRKHGGELVVESPAEGGTRFIARVPHAAHLPA
jgi:signal transduction histidine kinase